MKKLAGLLLACAVALSPVAATALEKGRVIRIVTAFPAGGVTDIAGRIMAEALTKSLGQTFIVENKPGGDGLIGLMDVFRARPDGHTILLGGFGGELIPPLVKKDFPIDVQKDLTLIARPAGFVNVLVVNKDSPIHSLSDLIAYAKEHPGGLNYGSSASSSSDRLTTEMFMQKTGVTMTHIPYKGAAPALNDLAAGITQLIFANFPAAKGLIEGGAIRPIAVTSTKRVPQLPDVPTMQEAGLADFEVVSWVSFFGPRGMAPEDVKTLSDAIVNVTKDPAVQQALSKVGYTVIGEGSEAFKVSYVQEKERWSKVIEAAGISR